MFFQLADLWMSNFISGFLYYSFIAVLHVLIFNVVVVVSRRRTQYNTRLIKFPGKMLRVYWFCWVWTWCGGGSRLLFTAYWNFPGVCVAVETRLYCLLFLIFSMYCIVQVSYKKLHPHLNKKTARLISRIHTAVNVIYYMYYIFGSKFSKELITKNQIQFLAAH